MWELLIKKFLALATEIASAILFAKNINDCNLCLAQVTVICLLFTPIYPL